MCKPTDKCVLVIVRLAVWMGLVALPFGLVSHLQAAPANDNCSGAEIIPPSGPFPHLTSIQNITLATTNGDPLPPSCYSFDLPSLARSVWYSFTPDVSASYAISTCTEAPTSTTVVDTVMALYTADSGCDGPMVEVVGGCSDDFCNTQSAVLLPLQAGTRYFIVVWRYGTEAPSPDASSLQLLVNVTTPPPNDDCESAIALDLNVPVRGTTAFGANDYELSTNLFIAAAQYPSTASGRDVVYSFVAPASAEYSFRVSNFDADIADPVLYVTDSCPSGPRPILVTDPLAFANRALKGTSEEIVCVPLVDGQKVYVFVDDTLTNGSGFILTATTCIRETEPNDTTASLEGPICGVEGLIAPVDDVDFYFLGVPAAGSRLFAILDGEAAAFTDFNMRVVTESGTLEFDAGNNDEAFGIFSPNVAGTPLLEVPTYLRIDRNFSSRSQTNQPYRLYAVIQPPLATATHADEPDNTLGQAHVAPNNYYYGSLSSSNDVDSFQFDAAAGDVVFVSLDGDPLRNQTAINGYLELLDENANLLLNVDDGASSSLNTLNNSTNTHTWPNSPGEGLVYRVAASGTYFVRVGISRFATGSSAAGDYLLSISLNCVPNGDIRPLEPAIQSIVQLADGKLQINFQGTPGVPYRMEWSADFTNWSVIPGSARTTWGDGSCQYEEANSGATQRFYRAVWP